MSLLLSTVWNALQNFTSLTVGGMEKQVIIEQVEPPSQVNTSLSFLVRV